MGTDALAAHGELRRPSRWLIVGAATAFYIGRVSSALYFAPHAIVWAADPTGADLADVAMWTTLNWIRIASQDTLTAVLLLLALARNRR
jgi:hypothetical protein